MNIMVFRDATPCTKVITYHHFRSTHCSPILWSCVPSWRRKKPVLPNL